MNHGYNQPFYLPAQELAHQKDLAESGDALAARRVGEYYLFIRRSDFLARMWLKMAADRGDDRARNLLKKPRN